MNDGNLRLANYIEKIEEILLNKCKPLHKPFLSHDLSFVLMQAANYKYSKNEKHKKICTEFIDKLIDNFESIEFGIGFLESFEGIIWLFNYLNKNGIVEVDNYIRDLMPFLYDSVEHDLERNNYDLLHGIPLKIQTLINYYGIEDERTRRYLDSFIDNLFNSKVQKGDCMFWYDESYPDGTRGANLGYAHGLPSLLVFLLKVKSLNYEHSRLSVLIQGIINSLLGFKYKNRTDCSFPAVYKEIEEENTGDNSRLAFCYGDLGVAFSLLYASKILDEPSLYKISEEIVDKICLRGITDSSIMHYDQYNFFDTSFCHGISGILLLLMKINRVLNSRDLTYRINYWTYQLFENLDIQLGIKEPIKFPFQRQPTNGDEYIFDEECILMGYSGTGLVLLSMMDKDDDWSEVFLLDSLN